LGCMASCTWPISAPGFCASFKYARKHGRRWRWSRFTHPLESKLPGQRPSVASCRAGLQALEYQLRCAPADGHRHGIGVA
jgi:hypothetical protein